MDYVHQNLDAFWLEDILLKLVNMFAYIRFRTISVCKCLFFERLATGIKDDTYVKPSLS